MKKNEYLQQLEAELIKSCVPDTDDILAEYEHHFIMKLSEGYSEEEISARLGSPEQIARQFEPESKKKNVSIGTKILLVTGISLLDIIMGCIFIALYAWVIAIGVLGISAFVLGFSLVGGIRFNELIIPYMPYAGGLLLGISILALGVVAVMGTLMSHIYTIRFAKVYLRWHKNTLSSQYLPPLSLKPDLSGKFLRRVRKITVFSSIIFAVISVTANIVLFAYADFQAYWHAWNWFV